MEDRVSDLSTTQLHDLFADRIRGLVKRVCGWHCPVLEDRMQSAWIELMQYSRDNRGLTVEAFIPRAMTRIRSALIDEMRAEDPLSRSQRVMAKKLRAAGQKLSQRNGKKASVKELAEELELEVSEVHDMIFRLHTDVVLYASEQIEEAQIESFTDCVLDSVILEQSMQKLLDAIETLSERDREVIQLRYYQELTNREIAKRLNIVESRATKLHQRGVEKLRQALQAA